MSEIPFTGFYPSRPFWAGDKLTLKGELPSQWQQDSFEAQMKKEVFTKETESYALRVCRDGRILLRVPALEHDNHIDKLSGYLDYLNAFYLLLDSATLEIDHRSHFNLHELTHRDVIRVTYREDGTVSENLPSESVASTFQLGRYLSSYRPDLPIRLDSRISMRQVSVVSLKAITHACTLFESVVSSPQIVTTLSSFAKSLAQYKVENYSISLILAWFIIESDINRLWKQKIDSLNHDIRGVRRINSDRKKYLTGRDFTISIVSNMTELFGVLDHALFKDIDRIRKCRNDLVHEEKLPSAADACLAMKTALSMIESRWSVKLTPNFSRSRLSF